MAVTEWWSMVSIRDRLFVNYLPQVHEVSSDDAWPDWAVLQALHAEYLASGYAKMTRLQFAHWLKKCTPIYSTRSTLHFKSVDEKGRVKWYGSNVQYMIRRRYTNGA